MVDWDSSFNTNPDPTDPVGQGDDEILATRQAVNERARAALDWNDFDAGYSGTGRPLPGSARAFFQAAAPTGLLAANGTDTAIDRLGSSLLDDGRLWIDSDDANRLYVRNQTAGTWDPVSTFPAIPSTIVQSLSARTDILSSLSTLLEVTSVPIPSSRQWRLMVMATIQVHMTSIYTIYLTLEKDDGNGSGYDTANPIGQAWAESNQSATGGIVGWAMPVHMIALVDVPTGDNGNTYKFRVRGVYKLGVSGGHVDINEVNISGGEIPATVVSKITVSYWPVT